MPGRIGVQVDISAILPEKLAKARNRQGLTTDGVQPVESG
jgi:hypothetical protein